jgi:hypothetical protein
MFSANPIDLTQPFSFTAVLNFGCKNSNGADGMVFILTTSNTALGGVGGAIGYENSMTILMAGVIHLLITWQ